MVPIQTYAEGLTGVRCENPDVRLSTTHDPAVSDTRVLIVEYPESTGEPAERDIWCDADSHDWSSGRGISFQAKPDEPVTLSVSFMGTNGLAYTAWPNLTAGTWQPVEIPFHTIRPNPYFQPPGADLDAPFDVSDVSEIGFAPQGEGSGRLAITRFFLVD